MRSSIKPTSHVKKTSMRPRKRLHAWIISLLFTLDCMSIVAAFNESLALWYCRSVCGVKMLCQSLHGPMDYVRRSKHPLEHVDFPLSKSWCPCPEPWCRWSFWLRLCCKKRCGISRFSLVTTPSKLGVHSQRYHRGISSEPSVDPALNHLSVLVTARWSGKNHSMSRCCSKCFNFFHKLGAIGTYGSDVYCTIWADIYSWRQTFNWFPCLKVGSNILSYSP